MHTQWRDTPENEDDASPQFNTDGSSATPPPPPPVDHDDVDAPDVVIRREVHHTEFEVYTYRPRRR